MVKKLVEILGILLATTIILAIVGATLIKSKEDQLLVIFTVNDTYYINTDNLTLTSQKGLNIEFSCKEQLYSFIEKHTKLDLKDAYKKENSKISLDDILSKTNIDRDLIHNTNNDLQDQ